MRSFKEKKNKEKINIFGKEFNFLESKIMAEQSNHADEYVDDDSGRYFILFLSFSLRFLVSIRILAFYEATQRGLVKNFITNMHLSFE